MTIDLKTIEEQKAIAQKKFDTAQKNAISIENGILKLKSKLDEYTAEMTKCQGEFRVLKKLEEICNMEETETPINDEDIEKIKNN